MTREEFVARAVAHALAAVESTGVAFNVAAAVGQACLESNFGKQTPPSSNNILGIKAGKSWAGPTVNAQTKEQTPAGTNIDTSADWRMYENWQHCFEDYAGLIRSRPWYEGALNHPDDPAAYLRALMPVYGSDGRVLKSGYATDINYVEKVMSIVWGYGVENAVAEIRGMVTLPVPETGSLRLDWASPAVTRVFIGDHELTGINAIGIVDAGDGTAKLYIR